MSRRRRNSHRAGAPDVIPPAPTTAAADDPPRKVHASLWWLIALLFALGSHPLAITELVRVIDPPEESVLAPDWAWSPPLSQWSAFEPLSEWPLWLAAGGGAACIAGIAARLSRTMPPWLVALTVAALGLAFEPRQLVPAMLILAAGLIAERPLSPAKRSACWIAIALAAVGTSIEFGCVLLAMLWNPLPERPRMSREFLREAAPFLIATAGLAAAAAFSIGFRNALLRPVSWVWLRPPAELLPSLQSPFIAGRAVAELALLVAPFVVAWLRVQRYGATSRPSLAPLLLWSLLGLG